jgi:D-alanine-D-alanine ligase
MSNVGIICGGFSSEFDISVKSARNILDNFPGRYNTYLILLSDSGWQVDLDGNLIDLDERSFTFDNNGVNVEIDLCGVYIHGDPGENGKIQAYLEMINMPYLNSGPLASQLSFDKWFCNQFLKGFSIPVANSVYLMSENEIVDEDAIIEKLGLPVFVKPCDSGSSYGIARVNEKSKLASAITAAFEEGDTVVIEEFLDGVEVTCGVYRSIDGVKALPLTEIVSQNEFFDYEAKYQGLSDEITPARVDPDIAEKVQALSKRIYQLMQLRSIARIDFMLVNNEPYVIEVNTTPGFSNASIVPKMISVAGMEVTQLWNEILEVEGF